MNETIAMSLSAQRRILAKIEGLRQDLAGDVKRLTNFTPEYRLRVGDYRILFEVEGGHGCHLSHSASERCIPVAGGAMLKLHPEILEKNGKKEFVVLPYEEFLALRERLADAEDLLELRQAKRAEAKKKSIPLAQVKRRLKIQSPASMGGFDVGAPERPR